MAGERTQEHVEAELAEVDAAIIGKEGGEVVTSRSPDPETLAIEKEASRHGWVAKEYYKGDPAKWKPAQQYLDEGLRYNKNIKRELEELKGKYAHLEKTGQAFAKYHEEQMARKDQELKDAITETTRKLREAVRDGDDNLADTLEARKELLQEERAALKKQEPVDPTPQQIQEPQTVDPVVAAWIEDDNQWFEEDSQLREHALRVGREMRAAGETAQGRKMLDLVAQRVRDDFPRRFKKQQTTRQSQVESSDSGGVGSVSYSIHDLPPEDLALMKEFIAKGWTTKDKFLKNYFEGGKKVHKTR